MISKIIVVLLLLQTFSVLNATEEAPSEAANKLKTLTTKLHSKYIEMDSYLDVLLMASLLEQHVLAFGGPGGSKTQTAKDVLKALNGKIFSLQFSPSTKAEVITGALKGKKYLEEGAMEYVTDQSLFMHHYAILDEIDKANPDVLATLISVLNERKAMLGSQEIKGELRTALITSNMTLNDFLEKFAATNDRPTGQAILDRVMFKVLVVNRLSSVRNLNKLLSRSSGGDETPWPTQIELRQVRQEINKIKVPEEVKLLALHLWMRILQVLEAEQQKQSDLCQEDPMSMRYPYIMANQFSTRGVTNILDMLKVGKFLKELHSDQMHAASEIELSPEDIQLIQSFLIMQGPGDLQNGKQLESIRAQFAGDARTLKMIDDLKFERTSFLSEYQEILKLYQAELVDLAADSLIAQVIGQGDLSTLGPKAKQEILEKILQIENRVQARQAKSKAAGDVDDVETVAGVARGKVMRELKDLRALLQSEQTVIESARQKEQARHDDEEKVKEPATVKAAPAILTEDVKTSTGAIYKRYHQAHPLLGNNVFSDPRGLVWGDYIQNSKVQSEAENYCKQLSSGTTSCRLPTVSEFNQLNSERATNLLPNINNKNYWATLGQGSSMADTAISCGFHGGIFAYPSSFGPTAFRCVCTA